MGEVRAAMVAFAVGVLVAAAAAWGLVRRHLRQVRDAERRARTAERLAEIGAMTGGLAHEIKNPLSTIGLNAQLLSEGVAELDVAPESKGRLTRRVEALQREVERLRGILTDFLQYAGQPRLEPRPTDLNAVVDELVDFFLPQAEKSGVRLRADLARGPLIANLDAAHVKQAVLNLMLNAVQAMTDGPGAGVGGGGGRGGPGGGAGRPRELILRTTRETDRSRRPVVCIHIIDTGRGMDAATLERVFEPYFTTKSGGTGLGLPTARRLVEGHDGRIEVHSEPGRGTDFTVSFPIVND
jgi:signal transduction histidine kinase